MYKCKLRELQEDVLQGFGPTRVDVAIELYILALLSKWDDASTIALQDEAGEINKPKAVSQAYESYKKWFEQVKKGWLRRARDIKLWPLTTPSGSLGLQFPPTPTVPASRTTTFQR